MAAKPRSLTAGEAAKALGVHINTVRRWADDGTLACLQAAPGKHRRILASAVDDYVARLTAPPQSRAA